MHKYYFASLWPDMKTYDQKLVDLRSHYAALEQKFGLHFIGTSRYYTPVNFREALATPRHRWYAYKEGFSPIFVENFIRENLRNLIKYIPVTKIRYITNFDDEILSMDWHESELENDDLKNYKAKAEFYVRQHQDMAVITKLRSNIPLTDDDILALEKILWSEVGTKEDYEVEIGSKPLGEFVREIVGLDMKAAKEAFAEYLDEAVLDSRQIYFVNQIVEYIVHNGLMKDLSVLQESPFTDQGSVVEIFTDLTVWMGIRKIIEQVNSNAVA